jgi:hypothetical protein
VKRPNAVGLVVVTCAAVVLVAALALTTFGIGDAGTTDKFADPYLFSSERGDPITVWVSADIEGEAPCTNMAGVGYGTSVSCFAQRSAYNLGAYSLVVPEKDGLPALVVGIAPLGATQATVRVRSERVRAEMRGRWFLAQLRYGELGPDDGASFDVEFD